MPTIEELRAAMDGARNLSGSGNYLPKGKYKVQISKVFFKKATVAGKSDRLIAEFTVLESSTPEVTAGSTFSENWGYDKMGWMERWKKFVFSTLGVDWRSISTLPAEHLQKYHQYAADVRFCLEFEFERAKLGALEGGLLGRVVLVEASPYTTQAKKEITTLAWSPAPQAVA